MVPPAPTSKGVRAHIEMAIPEPTRVPRWHSLHWDDPGHENCWDSNRNHLELTRARPLFGTVKG